MESKSLQAEEKTLRHVIHQAGSSGLIGLTVDGQDYNVMVRKIQRHPVTGQVIHVDLYRVRMDQKTRIRVPLAFVGDAPGVTIHDGMLLHAIEAVNVEALPADMPHHIEVDVSVLADLDQALHIRDLTVPANVAVLDDPDELIVKIQPPRKVEEELAPAEEAAPQAAPVEAAAEASAEAQPSAEAAPAAEAE
jgi:large subunit ribosomal protein L25